MTQSDSPFVFLLLPSFSAFLCACSLLFFALPVLKQTRLLVSLFHCGVIHADPIFAF